MSIINVKSTIECDSCGSQFIVFLDQSEKLAEHPNNWCLFELIEDVVRGGVGTNDPIGKSTSVQDGQMLCHKCTKEKDERDEKLETNL